MKQGLAVVGLIVLCTGCASWMDYQDLQSKHDHLLDEKERLETEQTDLRAIVVETRRSYQVASQNMGALQAQIEQTIQTSRAAREELAKTKALAESHTQELRLQGQRVTQLGTQFDQLMGQVSTMSERNLALTDRVDQLLQVTKRISSRIAESPNATGKASAAKTSPKDKSEPVRVDKTAKAVSETAGPVADPVEQVRKGEFAAVPAVRGGHSAADVKPLGVATGSSGPATVVTPAPAGASAPLPAMAPVEPASAGVATSVDLTKSTPGMSPAVASSDPVKAKPQITRSDLSPVPVSRFEQLKSWASGWLPGASKPTVDASRPVPPASGASDVNAASTTSPAGGQKLLTISEHPGVPTPDAVVTVPVVPPSGK